MVEAKDETEENERKESPLDPVDNKEGGLASKTPPQPLYPPHEDAIESDQQVQDTPALNRLVEDPPPPGPPDPPPIPVEDIKSEPEDEEMIAVKTEPAEDAIEPEVPHSEPNGEPLERAEKKHRLTLEEVKSGLSCICDGGLCATPMGGDWVLIQRNEFDTFIGKCCCAHHEDYPLNWLIYVSRDKAHTIRNS